MQHSSLSKQYGVFTKFNIKKKKLKQYNILSFSTRIIPAWMGWQHQNQLILSIQYVHSVLTHLLANLPTSYIGKRTHFSKQKISYTTIHTKHVNKSWVKLSQSRDPTIFCTFQSFLQKTLYYSKDFLKCKFFV